MCTNALINTSLYCRYCSGLYWELTGMMTYEIMTQWWWNGIKTIF